MNTINSMEEYLYLVDETLFDAGDLLMALSGDGEDGNDETESDISYSQELETQLTELQQSITDGSYQFADQDLPFMQLLQSHGAQIPFADRLELINHTHRQGLAG